MESVEELLGVAPHANDESEASALIPVHVSCVSNPEVATIESSKMVLPDPYSFDAVMGMDQLPAVVVGPLMTPVVALIVQPSGKPAAA